MLSIVLYAGLPGTGINANMYALRTKLCDSALTKFRYELMKQQGLAKTTFRKTYAVAGLLNAFQSYVNEQAGETKIRYVRINSRY